MFIIVITSDNIIFIKLNILLELLIIIFNYKIIFHNHYLYYY